MTKPTLAELQARFPDPVKGQFEQEPGEQKYCVGGALCLFVYSEPLLAFPDAGDLEEVLCAVNPDLEVDMFELASRIIAANDDGAFAEAWDLLGQALGEEPHEA